MTKKLNSYFLMDNTINLMKSLLDDSKKKSIEHGFDLCVGKRERILKAENPCIGDKCQVELLGRCKENENLVGCYHTHPPPFSSRPSLDDLSIGLNYGINCIGTAKEDNIICYVKKDDISFQQMRNLKVKISKLISKQENRSLTYEDIKEIENLENNVKKDYFHKYVIK